MYTEFTPLVYRTIPTDIPYHNETISASVKLVRNFENQAAFTLEADSDLPSKGASPFFPVKDTTGRQAVGQTKCT